MAYTGTGTEADPYCVSNLTDFMECIKKSGAYVKVIADIDAAADPAYTGELTASLEIACKYVYADEQKAIKGITIYAANFIQITNRTNVFVENLSFTNCEHQRTTNSDSISASFGNNFFKNCKFSMKIVDYSGGFSTNHIAFERCAGNLIYTAVRAATTFSSASFQNCNFVLEGFHWTNNYPLLRMTVNKTGFIFDNLKITSAGNNTFNIYGSVSQNCYVAFIDLETTSDSIFSTTQVTSSGTSLVALQNKPTNLVVDAKLTEITPDQLKNKEYLASIGFFP